jgi:hypothetical protein
MGWASGTDIAEVIAKILLKYVPKNKLKQEAKKALNALEEMDWDCVEEVELFDYINLLKWGRDELEEEWAIEDYDNKVKKYKKKFGF